MINENKQIKFKSFLKNSGFFGIFIFLYFFVSFTFSSLSNLNVSLIINGGGFTIGVESGLTLGSIQVGQNQQELTGQFVGYFWVQDFNASPNAFYTTIRSDGLYGPNNEHLTGIYFKVDDIYPDLLLGNAGDVFISNNLLNYTSINNPQTYIYREAGTNNLNVNKYGDKPHIKVVIPPYSAPGSYSGTIYFDM